MSKVRVKCVKSEEFILTETSLIQNAENVAHFIHDAGSIVMSLALF